MRGIIALTPFLPWLLTLASCSSPPKPPGVDESQKRPVNAPLAVELQTCRHELQNTRILVRENTRLAETTATSLAVLQARQMVTASTQGNNAPHEAANRVYTVRFELGSTNVAIPPEISAALVEAAKSSPLILLRGRTDGTSDIPIESRIARERAEAVRNHLVAAGVDPARIRATYQPVGDHVGDNASAQGRNLNRRVEIELYRALPVTLSPTIAAQP
ncbi:OmpA family protein [Ideonella sp. 4Y16]|uniref:OmpA family protein n=1 Tax=Ideonella alba TaxID=2824118 RepID=A0A940YHS8_9BURK|nr:OmpA family protein [Ideonella alba]MBQ0933641.1 OmpA family protein [Ideonella alba]MBQ0946229.1 OmpA family protein [Ideonella alba]